MGSTAACQGGSRYASGVVPLLGIEPQGQGGPLHQHLHFPEKLRPNHCQAVAGREDPHQGPGEVV
jgi:hypothetical protein